MKVLKFGGTSVADGESIKRVGQIVKNEYKKRQGKIIVVVSAMGGATNELLGMSEQAKLGDENYLNALQKLEKRCFDIIQILFPSSNQSEISASTKRYINELEDILQGVAALQDLSSKTKDKIASFGEVISSTIIQAYFNSVLQLPSVWMDSRMLIKTDATFGNAVVQKDISYKNIQAFVLQKNPQAEVFVAPGFVGSNEAGQITTIGRGGSDYSASLIAVAINASILEIWTDVSGMMTADPRLVKHAHYIEQLDYSTALELCHFGAKVIFPPTLEPIMEQNIPLVVKNTFAPNDKGTFISEKISKDVQNKYTGISSIKDIAMLSMRGNGVMRLTSIMNRLFRVLHEAQIPVLLTTQGSSEHYVSIALSVDHIFHAKECLEKEFLEDIEHKKITAPLIETDLSVVALVGSNMRNQPGVAGRMFSVLGRNGINLRAIAQGSSERNISFVVKKQDMKKANLTLHEEFFEEKYKMLHIFVVGVGNVGSKLLQQIHAQKEALKKSMGLRIKVVGIANSTNMLFNEDGVDLSTWKEQLNGSSMSTNLDEFIQHISNLNLRNSIFVDITADKEVAMKYDQILPKSIAVVACNKIACSVDYAYYEKLKLLSKKYNASLMFETNVGAALPVIETLNGLIKSGDEIERIDAVLSGTLNFVFNNYNAKTSFSSIVKKAQEEGYTEPDPRVDLSGIDVLRKILILAREAGQKMDVKDVTVNGFLPDEIMKVDIKDLYPTLEKYEAEFKKLYNAAIAQGCILKFVARYEHGKASVGLQHISPNSDMYHLYNKDNIVLFYTRRYKEQPLVIKGAGAGAEVTASGIFADILKSRY